jgi:hypothetical protein
MSWVFVQPLFKDQIIQIKQPGYLERTSVLDFVGAAFSRDHFNSRLEAAPTGVFYSYLDLPDKRIKVFCQFN